MKLTGALSPETDLGTLVLRTYVVDQPAELYRIDRSAISRGELVVGTIGNAQLSPSGSVSGGERLSLSLVGEWRSESDLPLVDSFGVLDGDDVRPLAAGELTMQVDLIPSRSDVETVSYLISLPTKADAEKFGAQISVGDLTIDRLPARPPVGKRLGPQHVFDLGVVPDGAAVPVLADGRWKLVPLAELVPANPVPKKKRSATIKKKEAGGDGPTEPISRRSLARVRNMTVQDVAAPVSVSMAYSQACFHETASAVSGWVLVRLMVPTSGYGQSQTTTDISTGLCYAPGQVFGPFHIGANGCTETCPLPRNCNLDVPGTWYEFVTTICGRYIGKRYAVLDGSVPNGCVDLGEVTVPCPPTVSKSCGCATGVRCGCGGNAAYVQRPSRSCSTGGCGNQQCGCRPQQQSSCCGKQRCDCAQKAVHAPKPRGYKPLCGPGDPNMNDVIPPNPQLPATYEQTVLDECGEPCGVLSEWKWQPNDCDPCGGKWLPSLKMMSRQSVCGDVVVLPQLYESGAPAFEGPAELLCDGYGVVQSWRTSLRVAEDIPVLDGVVRIELLVDGQPTGNLVTVAPNDVINGFANVAGTLLSPITVYDGQPHYWSWRILTAGTTASVCVDDISVTIEVACKC